MAAANSHETAQLCLATALAVDPSTVFSLVRGESEIWDSIKHIELMFVIEDETGVAVTPEQLASVKDLASLTALIESIAANN